MNAIMPRETIEIIIANRDETIRLYDEAYEACRIADEKVKAAHAMAQRTAPTAANDFTYNRTTEIENFYKIVQLPDMEEFKRVAKQITDLRVWSHIVQMTDLQRLMDREAKDKLRDQMRYVPLKDKRRERGSPSRAVIDEDEIDKGMPPLTVDNVYATLEMFRENMGMIFRRGVANAFSQLDRRFRSHDGFKIGARIILTYMFNDWGSMNDGAKRDTLIDVERVFAILDGKPEGSFQSTLWMIEEGRRKGYTLAPRQSEHENEYFLVRCYKNGNAHLWFRRDDLVEKVNKVLAEYYGEVIGDAQQQEEDPLAQKKTTPARYYGFFPTPPAAVDCIFSSDRRRGHGPVVLRSASQPQLRILEPSAGTGNLARRCVRTIEELDDWHGGRSKHAHEYRFDNIVDCVEIQPHLARGLEAEGIYNRVICADFLALRPVSSQLYDLVVMNPPFDRERDIDHVTHALGFLKPGGSLHAIMSAGTEFRETKKSIAFRALIEKMGGKFHDLPEGSFAEVGTYVNTCILRVTKPK